MQVAIADRLQETYCAIACQETCFVPVNQGDSSFAAHLQPQQAYLSRGPFLRRMILSRFTGRAAWSGSAGEYLTMSKTSGGELLGGAFPKSAPRFSQGRQRPRKGAAPLAFFLDCSKVLPGIPVNFLMCSLRFLQRAEVPQKITRRWGFFFMNFARTDRASWRFLPHCRRSCTRCLKPKPRTALAFFCEFQRPEGTLLDFCEPFLAICFCGAPRPSRNLTAWGRWDFCKHRPSIPACFSNRSWQIFRAPKNTENTQRRRSLLSNRSRKSSGFREAWPRRKL